MSITQIITELPPAPQRTDAPADFITKADAHVASLDQFVTQTNVVTSEINSTATDVNSSALAAQASADEAANSAESSASSANFKGEWSALTGALNIPASVSHLDSIWVLKASLADVTANEPSVSGDWIATTSSAWNAPKTADFNIVASQDYLIDGSSGAVDASLPSVIATAEEFIVHNESISTNLVRVLNPNFTIKGAGGTLSSGDNLILEAGDTVNLVARSNSILEVV